MAQLFSLDGSARVMDSNVKVSFSYLESDLVRAWQLRFAPQQRRMQYGGFALALAVWAIYMFYATRSRFEWALFFFTLSLFALLLVGGIAFRSLFPRLLFRFGPKYRQAYSLTFSAKGIRVEAAHQDSWIEWSRYSRALVDADSYLLCYGSSLFTLIPRRAFMSAEAQQMFEQLLSRFIPEIVRRDT